LGDFQGGEYHGVGMMQIDIQHPIARLARDTGSWHTDPQPLIDFGVNLLADDLIHVKAEFPTFDYIQRLKIIASAYNCGLQPAINGIKIGDSDKFTTGRNYGKDVMSRMKSFATLIGT
jgi:hypothetical protein